MPASAARRPSCTITVIADGHAEEIQARVWRPIARHWPSFAPPPELQVLSWDQATDSQTELGGAVALLVGASDHTDSGLYLLLERLRDELIPAMALATGEKDPLHALHDECAHVIPSDTDPVVVSAMLCALAERQTTVDMLRGEIRIARRFQGGLRGEIDKIHEELQLAASVQREFLPRELPTAPNIDVQVLFRPCGYVSGDIYDVQRLDEHRVGFFVADAVGHGVPAALMTMVLCRCLRTKVMQKGSEVVLSPSAVLSELNAQMVERHGDHPRFATAVYGVIDTRTRSVTLSGAGHPHPLRIQGDQVERVSTEGGLLGVFPEAEFDEATFTLGPDEVLVIYSDGFETAFPAPSADQYGRRVPNSHFLSRFVDLAATWRASGLGAALRGLNDQIDRQAGSLHQVDDLTAMVISPKLDRPVDRLFHGQTKGNTVEPAPKPRPADTPAPR